MILETINSPNDLKKLNISEMELLSQEIRDVIIKKTSEKGGHLGSNLGIVELTIAIHYVFDSPLDQIILDVSHQSAPHKILTGRKEAFSDSSKYGTISGFTNPDESAHDLFNIGHTLSHNPQLIHFSLSIFGYLNPFSSSIISIAFLGHLLKQA